MRLCIIVTLLGILGADAAITRRQVHNADFSTNSRGMTFSPRDSANAISSGLALSSSPKNAAQTATYTILVSRQTEVDLPDTDKLDDPNPIPASDVDVLPDTDEPDDPLLPRQLPSLPVTLPVAIRQDLVSSLDELAKKNGVLASRADIASASFSPSNPNLHVSASSLATRRQNLMSDFPVDTSAAPNRVSIADRFSTASLATHQQLPGDMFIAARNLMSDFPVDKSAVPNRVSIADPKTMHAQTRMDKRLAIVGSSLSSSITNSKGI